MIIDWHAHVYPPELAKERRWGGTTPLTIENLLEAHEKAGIERCVVSNTIHYLKDKTHDESLAFLRRWNEYAAEIQQKYRDRIIVFTSTLPCGGAPFMKELERAMSNMACAACSSIRVISALIPTTTRPRRFSSWLAPCAYR